MLCAQVVFALSGVGVPDLHSVLATRLVSRRRSEFATSKACRFLQRAFRTACGFTATEQCRNAADSLPNSSETAARQQARARKLASLPPDRSGSVPPRCPAVPSIVGLLPDSFRTVPMRIVGLLPNSFRTVPSIGGLLPITVSEPHLAAKQLPSSRLAALQLQSPTACCLTAPEPDGSLRHRTPAW